MTQHQLETPLRILAAVDDSAPAARAFAHALAIARQEKGRITALHAIPPSRPFARGARAADALFERLRAEAAEAGVDYRTARQAGDAADTILAHANGHEYDLVVLGTHQRRGLRRLRRGSVAARVAAGAASPVLVVPVSPLTDSRQPYERVLCATRLGDASGAAVAAARALAASPDTRVTLVHVVTPPPPDWAAAFGVHRFAGDPLPPAAGRAWRALDRHAWRGAFGRRVHGRVLTGHLVPTLETAVESGRMDVAVLGRSRPRLGNLWGAFDTVGRLLRSLPSAMLVVPHDYTGRTGVSVESLPPPNVTDATPSGPGLDHRPSSTVHEGRRAA